MAVVITPTTREVGRADQKLRIALTDNRVRFAELLNNVIMSYVNNTLRK